MDSALAIKKSCKLYQWIPVTFWSYHVERRSENERTVEWTINSSSDGEYDECEGGMSGIERLEY